MALTPTDAGARGIEEKRREVFGRPAGVRDESLENDVDRPRMDRAGRQVAGRLDSQRGAAQENRGDPREHHGGAPTGVRCRWEERGEAGHDRGDPTRFLQGPMAEL
jgi:hypothetical protein